MKPFRERTWLRTLGPWLILLLVAVVLPPLVRPTVAAEMLMFAIAAVAFNLLLGYTGLLSFGQATFVGAGAYVAGYLLIHYKVNLFVALVAAMLAGMVVATVVGYLAIQRIGLYFIMLTFAFNLMAYFVVYQWSPVTGGADGLPGIPRPPVELFGVRLLDLTRAPTYYWFVVVLFFLCTFTLKRLVDSPLGKILQAIRDNPQRAAALGYNVQAYKRLAFAISGAYSGLVGILYAMLFGIVPIDLIFWITSGNIVFMTLIGGVSSFWGPIVGAIFFIWLAETVSVIWQRWPLIVGVVFAVVIFFFRGGMVEVWGRLAAWTRGWQKRWQGGGR
jgi:branched-chain amino acid transport system permease protein